MMPSRDASIAWLKTIAVYVLAGPLVGFLVVVVMATIWGWWSGPPSAAWLGPFLFIYGWLFAHYFGAASALVAGVAACALAALLGRPAWWIGVASGSVSALVSLLNGGLLLPHDGIEGLEIVLIAAHLVAAHASWSVARRWFAGPAL